MAKELMKKLNDALDKYGRTNGTAAPNSQDPATEAAHEYLCTSVAESYFKKRREAAKAALQKKVSVPMMKKLNDKIKALSDDPSIGGSKSVVLETDAYSTQVGIKVGASFLDTAKLKVELMTTYKMSALTVEALIEKCTDRRAPSQSWEVVERETNG